MPDAQPATLGGPLPRGHLLALNRSFRRTLEAENKSPRTIEAYTDAVRLLATYCQAHGHPLLASELQRGDVQAFVADSSADGWKLVRAGRPVRVVAAELGLGRGDGRPLTGSDRRPRLPPRHLPSLRVTT